MSRKFTLKILVNSKQLEATWKLIIEINVLAIDARFLQLENYREQTEKLCEKLHENVRQLAKT